MSPHRPLSRTATLRTPRGPWMRPAHGVAASPLALALFAALAPASTQAQQPLLACRAATPAEAAFYTSPVMMPGVISPTDGTCFIKDLRITATDGVQLAANVFLPRGYTGGVRQGPGAPAVVYIGSWACAQWFEYLGQQARMARDGYVSLSYTARGFQDSGGVVNVATPQDIQDVSSAISFLLSKTPADAARVGATGISYGAGLSMLASAQDARIKAVAAMSGWGNLSDQLYGNAVPNITWAGVLVGAGALTGRMDPEMVGHAQTLVDPNSSAQEVAEAIAWAQPRSPSNAVDAINARKVPTFIAKNWQDDMFSPNSTLDMFARLTVPKKLMLQPGIHGSAELGGAIFGGDNAVYDESHRWFDRWLKGVANGVDAEPKVKLLPKLQSQGRYETLSNWPAPELKKTVYKIGARGDIRFDMGCFCWKGGAGTLSTGSAAAGMDSINNALDTVATTGIAPILSVTAETFDLPIMAGQGFILRDQGVRYEGPVLSRGLRIRGIPELVFRAKPSQGRNMLVAYLYSVDWLGMGTLISHGARAEHFGVGGREIDYRFRMNATAFDVPAGNRLALVFDTQDSLYGAPVNWGEGFSVAIRAGNGATLTIPSR